MSDEMRVDGLFDFSPDEETDPIWITNNLVTLFGEMDPPEREGVISLRLVKHLIFGTGGHPATRIAIWKLLALPNYDDPVPSPFLELGASTGLLALAAAVTGAEETYHGSDSIESSAIAEDNGVLNGHEIKVEPSIMALDVAGDRFNFYSCIATQRGGEAATLQYLPILHHALAPGGWVVWAGHEAKDHQSIKARLEEFFNPIEVDDFMGWPAIVLQKIKTT